jgi:hypothetical protein
MATQGAVAQSPDEAATSTATAAGQYTLEQQIAGTEGSILKLEGKIDKLEEALLKGDFSSLFVKTRKAALAELKELRRKEEQLRRKEEQLRRKEELLLLERQSLTRAERAAGGSC